MARRSGIPTPGATQGTAITPDHVRGYPGFIQKHPFRQIAGLLPGLPVPTLDDVLALRLTGDQRFFIAIAQLAPDKLIDRRDRNA
jgi:hypothetical protein